MKKLTIELPPERKIEINGMVFDVLPTDFEILELLTEVVSEFGKIAEEPDTSNIIDTLKNTLSVLDKILGEKAAERILMGRPASISFMLEKLIMPILSEVLNMAQSGYEKRIEDEYDSLPENKSVSGALEA